MTTIEIIFGTDTALGIAIGLVALAVVLATAALAAAARD